MQCAIWVIVPFMNRGSVYCNILVRFESCASPLHLFNLLLSPKSRRINAVPITLVLNTLPLQCLRLWRACSVQ